MAEEQAAARDLAVLVLGRLSYRVEPAVTAADTLHQARAHPASLILLSATLPDLPGAEAIARLRASPDAADVPIVAICPEDDDELRQACLGAGATACIGRPVEIERLLALLERLLKDAAPDRRDEPVLDLDHLRGFSDGDAQLEDELLTLFLSTADVYVQRLREAVAGDQPWGAIAHALKGASGNIGARRVHTLALAAEHSAPSATQLEAIEQALAEVRTSVEHRHAE